MRLLVVTARYPTEDRPAAGVFVRDRLADPDLRVTVVAPRSYAGSRWGRFLRLCWAAWTARGRFDGVEGHFVLPTGPVALIAARLRGVPFVVVAHGGDVRDSADGIAAACAGSPAGSSVAPTVVVANSAGHGGRDRRLVSRRTWFLPASIGPVRALRPTGGPAARAVPGGRRAPQGGRGRAPGWPTPSSARGCGRWHRTEVPALMAEHDVVLVPSLDGGVRAGRGGGDCRRTLGRRRARSAAWSTSSTDGVTGTLVTDGDFAAPWPRCRTTTRQRSRLPLSGSHGRTRGHAWRRSWEDVLAARRPPDQEGSV